MRISGQKRSKPVSKIRIVCSRNSTPRPMRTIAPTGTLPAVELLAHAEGLAQAHGIGRGLARLNSASGADGVDDLVDVEKRDAEAKDPSPVSGMVGGEDEHDEDQQVGQSFGVLRAIDGAHAEGKESSEDAGDRRIRPGARA